MIQRGLILIILVIDFGAVSFPAHGQEPGDTIAVIARTCTTCHHPGNQAIPKVPGDMDEQGLTARLQELRASEGDVTLMHRLARGIGEKQIEPLAHFLVESP